MKGIDLVRGKVAFLGGEHLIYVFLGGTDFVRRTRSGFAVLRLLGRGSLWVTEYIITYTHGPVYTTSIMEFRDGKVAHETQYFAEPFAAPAWRAQWVEKTRW